jgi:nucleoid-associated protein YgaU
MGNETSKVDFFRCTASNHVQSQIGSMADKTITHSVVIGDKLTKIEKHFNGGANAWKTIFDATRDHPAGIKTGQKLKIPAAP